jgi:hypothetical protein
MDALGLPAHGPSPATIWRLGAAVRRIISAIVSAAQRQAAAGFETMAIVRSVIAVVAGYLVFFASAIALFKITGQDPHAPASTAFMVLGILYGVAFAALSGFVAAWLAKRYEFEHSLGVASVIAAVGAASLLTRPGGDVGWTQLAALLVMAPSAIAGGWFRARQVGSTSQ